LGYPLDSKEKTEKDLFEKDMDIFNENWRGFSYPLALNREMDGVGEGKQKTGGKEVTMYQRFRKVRKRAICFPGRLTKKR